jgi:hypothetical protein
LRDREGLAAGEARGKHGGGLAGVAAFIDIGGPPRERVPQSSEQFASIAGSRGEPEGPF